MVVWQYSVNAYNGRYFNSNNELQLSTGSKHGPGADQVYFWHAVLGSGWLAVILYDAFWLGKYLFPVSQSL